MASAPSSLCTGCTYVPPATWPLNLGQFATRFLFRSVAAAQLFSLAVYGAGVVGQLITDDRPLTVALGQLDPSDLWQKVAALNHLCGAL
jgi:hypothetical protein